MDSAAYGAGDWQIAVTGYDDAGRVISQRDERATAAIRAAVADGGRSLTRFLGHPLQCPLN